MSDETPAGGPPRGGGGPGGGGPGGGGPERPGRRRRRRRGGRGPRAGAPGATPQQNTQARERPALREPERDRSRERERERDRGRPRPQQERRSAPPSTAPRPSSLGAPSSDLEAGWELAEAAAPLASPSGGVAPAAAQQYGYDDDDGSPLVPPLRLLAGPAPAPPDPDGDDVFVDLDETTPTTGVLTNVVGIKFQSAGKIYDYDAGDLALEPGRTVVIETEHGLCLAQVALESVRKMVPGSLRRVARIADPNDERQRSRNQSRDQEALSFGRDRARARKLDMKLFRVEHLHGGHKAIFYFTSESRVDFRDLVRDLAARLHTRIEMRQIGVRDEAKFVGGIGDCGRELCCTTWLPDFAPISIKMAKEQAMVLNPSRVSGQCGRLKCCLVYEYAQYREARRGLPKIGAPVMTAEGAGRVQDLNILDRKVRVALASGTFTVLPITEIQLPPRPSDPPREPSDPEQN